MKRKSNVSSTFLNFITVISSSVERYTAANSACVHTPPSSANNSRW